MKKNVSNDDQCYFVSRPISPTDLDEVKYFFASKEEAFNYAKNQSEKFNGIKIRVLIPDIGECKLDSYFINGKQVKD